MFRVVKQYSADSVQFRALDKVWFINYRNIISVQVFISKLSLLIVQGIHTNELYSYVLVCTFFSDFK